MPSMIDFSAEPRRHRRKCVTCKRWTHPDESVFVGRTRHRKIVRDLRICLWCLERRHAERRRSRLAVEAANATTEARA